MTFLATFGFNWASGF